MHNKPISTRWSPEWLPQWTTGFYNEEVAMIREAMNVIVQTTRDPKSVILAKGILNELLEAGERRIADMYAEMEQTPTEHDWAGAHHFADL